MADLLLSQMDGISVWSCSGKGPAEPEDPHSYPNPLHMSKWTIAWPLLISTILLTHLSHHLRIGDNEQQPFKPLFYRQGNDSKFCFYRQLSKKQPLLQQNGSYFMCRFHILVLFPLSVISSAGEKRTSFLCTLPAVFALESSDQQVPGWGSAGAARERQKQRRAL